MVQRIQSVYLLIASLFYFLYWFFGFEFYKEGYKIIENYLGNISSIFFSFTSILPFLIAIICFITLFLFKNRSLQIKLSKIALYISFFMSIYTLFYFSFSLDYLIGFMQSKKMELLLYAAILNPFFSTYLIFIAIKSINKDEKLVRGEGLIR